LGIVGQTGSGKSQLTRELALKRDRVVIFDPTDDDKYDNFFVVSNIREFCDAIVKSTFQIVARFPLDFDEVEQSDYSAAFKTLYYIDNLLVVFDEISIFATSEYIPRPIAHLILRGRRPERAVLWNTQRPQLVNITVRSQSQAILTMYMEEPTDLRTYNTRLAKGREIAQLNTGEYMILKGERKIAQAEEYFSYRFAPKIAKEAVQEEIFPPEVPESPLSPTQ
jgi:DNA helicase HerA-like ATPase